MKFGYIALAGLPNAGKSTLLNRLLGTPLSIVSPKPQTTRERVVGIRTDDESQIVFLDTPGLLEPGSELQARMRASALRALRDADVVLHVADARLGVPAPIDEYMKAAGAAAPVITSFTKRDLLRSHDLARLVIAGPPGAVAVSGLTGEGVNELVTTLLAVLPEGPAHYPADELSTHPVRFFVAEYIREAALVQLQDEIPHALACQVDEFREDRSPVYIRATLHVERNSQKRILIGTGGARIREIGRAARARVEALIGSSVYLDLWVKVQPRWRRDGNALDRLGYRNTE